MIFLCPLKAVLSVFCFSFLLLTDAVIFPSFAVTALGFLVWKHLCLVYAMT